MASPLATTTATLACLVTMMMMMMMTLVPVAMTQACEPKINPDDVKLEDKMWKSDVLVYGVPTHRTKDARYAGRRDMYIVDLQVHCIFKGGPLPESIRIHDVGMTDVQCLKTELKEGVPVLVYLKKESDRFVPLFQEDPGTEQFLEEVPVICKTTVTYPIGYTESNNKEECPAAWDSDDCVPLPSEDPFRGIDMKNYESEAPYQPVKSVDGGDVSNKNNKNKNKNQVKMGNKGDNKKKESGDMKQADGQGEKTPENRAGDNKTSLVTSLVTLCLCAVAAFFSRL